jgi:CO/xanthine dehydrogenase Mo-binding subunit
MQIMAGYSAVGKGINRVDTLEKVTGKTKFCTDIRVPGMLYGKVLRSPCAHAKILSIDITAAEKLPGVRGVITGKDVPEKRFGALRYAFDQHLLARNEVLFAGEAVAAVAADTPDIADEALDVIEVKYEEMPAIFDVEEAWQINPAVILHPDLPSYEQAIPSVRLDPDRPNICNHYKVRHGEIEEGFEDADLIVENRFTTARMQHCHLEPHACIANIEHDGSLTVWVGRQQLFGTKQYLCRTFNLPPSKVRVISSFYIGGGFGARYMFTVESITVMLAMKTGRPVRVAMTRKEEFTSGGNRIPCVIYIKDGVRKDGIIVARELKILVNIGAYASSGGAMLARNASFGAIGTYLTANLKLDSYAVYTNNPPVCALRGFASEQATWAIESQMDIIAEKLGIDAVDIRRQNLLQEGDFNANGEVVHSIGAKQCLEKVAEYIGWGGAPGQKAEPRRTGKGLALGNKYSYAGAVSISTVKVNEDGSIEVRYTADDFGQGTNTVMAQIAAEEFGLPIERVKVIWSDTAITPYSTQSTAQGTTFNTGNSVLMACQDAKQQLLQITAEKLGVPPEELDAKAGKIYVKSDPSHSIAVAELFSGGYIKKVGEIVGKGVWEQPSAPDNSETAQVPPELAKKGIGLTAFYAYASQAVEVAVDVETGEVKVVKFGTACDMGFPINPKMCEQQMDGGACMGMGSTLWEEMIMNNGQVINASLRDYKIPTGPDMPGNMKLGTFITPAPHRKGPYGAKGMGEVMITPAAPAIANAIYNAVGVRIRDLPASREKVLRALKEKRG